MSRSIVVVGAGLAGLRAVEQLRGAGWSDPITVLGTELHLPYNRPPLTKAALQGGVDPADGARQPDRPAEVVRRR